MEKIIYKDKFLNIAEQWFHIEAGEKLKCDILSYHDLKEPIIGVKNNIIIRKAQTLVNDLTLSTEELFSKFKSDTRTKIRRAQKKGVVTKFYSSADLLAQSEILDEFIEVHHQFLISKNMKGKLKKDKFKAYCEANMLALSIATQDGNNIGYHSYVVNGQIARGLYLAYLFSNKDQAANKSLIGDANRLLHWEEMCKFKELGFTIYDWGGYSKLERLKNVNKFKEEFGGKKEDRYHYLIPNSYLGNLGILALRGVNFVKNMKFQKQLETNKLGD